MATPRIHNEQTFEEAIEQSLVTAKGGYRSGNKDDYNIEFGLVVKEVVEFLKESQPMEWSKLQAIHKENTEANVIRRLVQELDSRGSLEVLRNGFTDYGVKFQMAYFKPENNLNPDSNELYAKNLLSVIRQLQYSKDNNNELDLVLTINGIPVATAELKNPFTNQTTDHAKHQYKTNRDPRELIFQFKKRSLVHFAVDTDDVFFTTQLKGLDTFFFPYNLGNKGGAGNPVNPDGYRTSYLWEYIWHKDSWLDLIGRFLHVEVLEKEVQGKKIKKETLIFPRYHQLDCVRKLTTDSKKNGCGKNYLIQHSAGSGKSNSIAWLAYRLANLHNADDKNVFDSVVVVTDRRVLDTQLQNTIYQFEHKTGVVQKIDKDSSQLAEALQKGTKIIITTLQKFPEIIGKVAEIPERRYAVIVDEAHSSQGGEASKKLKEVLSAKTLEQAMEAEAEDENAEDYEDEVRRSMMARGKQANLSFYAFTATPKPKTLEVFGVIGENGKPVPFHWYSMKQAIQEQFILDVLKGYTMYRTYYKLNKQIEDDPNLNKRKAAKAVARFVSLHPHNLAQKTEVIIEHFRKITSKKIGGLAKAMVVTSSRLHAVRYKQEFDRYITEKGYSDIRTLVAFSGTVSDGGVDFTEVGMNDGIREKELPKKFDTKEYQVLIVADKYQTGFDQPLLHTMYVDKKLSGVKAVQTLSRINRTCAGKEDTFILDFVNEAADIQASFQPFYELTTINEATDPNHLYNLKTEIEKAQVIWESDVENFTKVFYQKYFTAADQKKLYAFIAPAVERYKQMPKETANDIVQSGTQESFKHSVNVFCRLYAFLSQIMPFNDADLEKLYTYCRYLLNVLPKDNTAERIAITDEVALAYYRLQKVGEMDIELEEKGVHELEVLKEAGVPQGKPEFATLSEIVNNINDKFKTDFTDADFLFVQQIVEDCVTDDKLQDQAKNNSLANFKFGFEEVYFDKWIDRMGQNQELFTKVMDEKEFSADLMLAIMKEVYNRINPINR